MTYRKGGRVYNFCEDVLVMYEINHNLEVKYAEKVINHVNYKIFYYFSCVKREGRLRK